MTTLIRMSEQKKERCKVKLGPKGAKPPKKQLNPRKRKTQGLTRLITEFFDGNSDEVDSILFAYETGTPARRDSILTLLACHKKVPARLIRSIFNIGSHRFRRIKLGLTKQKPGGDKPNYVRCIILHS